jgi:serine protease Do
MNKRIILIAGGAVALGVVLVALPSPSVPLQQSAPDPQEAPAPPQPPGVVTVPEVEGLHDMVITMGDGNSWLGVETEEVTAENVKELKLPEERGALIEKVLPDSPAAKAGLKENDVVTEVNGQRVEGTVEFRRLIHEIPAGRQAQLTVWRDGHSENVAVTIGKAEQGHRMWMQGSPRAFTFRMPEIPEIPPMEWNGNFLMGMRPRLGIEAEDLEGQLGHYFGAPDGEGVLVQSVNSGSPAEKAGIKAGDVITSINGERIRTVGDLRAKLAAAKDAKSVQIGLLRDKKEMTISVELPEPAAPKTMREMAMRSTI